MCRGGELVRAPEMMRQLHTYSNCLSAPSAPSPSGQSLRSFLISTHFFWQHLSLVFMHHEILAATLAPGLPSVWRNRQLAKSLLTSSRQQMGVNFPCRHELKTLSSPRNKMIKWATWNYIDLTMTVTWRRINCIVIFVYLKKWEKIPNGDKFLFLQFLLCFVQLKC